MPAGFRRQEKTFCRGQDIGIVAGLPQTRKRRTRKPAAIIPGMEKGYQRS
jgi:hypothetical protein